MNRFRLNLPAMFVLTVLLLGCGGLKFQPDPLLDTLKAAPAGRGQIYKVPIALTQVPQTPGGQRLGDLFLEHLTQTIERKNAQIQLVTPGANDFPSFMASLPQVIGGGDIYAALQPARHEGYQAVILGAVTHLRPYTRNWGLLWFRRTNHYLAFSMTIDVYDPFTGAKLESRLKETVLKIDSTDYEGFQEGAIPEIEALDEELTETAEAFGEQAAGQLRKQPWKASIVGVQSGVIQLAVGAGAALAPDQKLAVYEARRMLKNRFGQSFVIPGIKIAEARVSHGEGGTAEAILEAAANVMAGDLAVAIP